LIEDVADYPGDHGHLLGARGHLIRVEATMRYHSGYVFGWNFSNGQSLLCDIYGLSQGDRLVLCHLPDLLSLFGGLRPDSCLLACLCEGNIIKIELVQLVLL